MRGITRVIIVGLVALVAIATPLPAFAHVTVSDGEKGGILHIDPDDNPVVGAPATLYLNVEGFDHAIESASLDVMLGTAHLDTVELDVDESTLSATYTFPNPGTYTLGFTITSDGEETEFTYDRDVAGDTYGSFHPWALALLVAASVGVGVLVILAIMNRKAIATNSVSKH